MCFFQVSYEEANVLVSSDPSKFKKLVTERSPEVSLFSIIYTFKSFFPLFLFVALCAFFQRRRGLKK